MFGLHSLKRDIHRWIRRRNYTITIILVGGLLTAFIFFAIYDFLQTAKAKDEQIQTADLRNELAQFTLALREDDGYPLLDNSEQLSKTTRPLTVISLRKPFFSYFLNTGNAKTFSTKEIRWEMPRSCTVEFSSVVDKRSSKENLSNKLQACLAVVPEDPNGRYIYFSIRYPDSQILRHVPGTSVKSSDFISLNLKGERELKLNLVFHQSQYAQSKFPSKMARFAGLHEVTAYLAEDMHQPLNSVNAQAYEQALQESGSSPQNIITILGRINASLVFPSLETSSNWPSPNVKNLTTALFVNDYDQLSGQILRPYEIPYGTDGTSLVSFEKLYVSLISSKAALEISKDRGARLLWHSDVLKDSAEKSVSVVQIFSDWWAKEILEIAGYKDNEAIVHNQILGTYLVDLTLKAGRSRVPDIATRSFLWLWLALILVAIFGSVCFRAIFRLKTITKTAYIMTATPTADESLDAYAERQDEIGTLGRTFNLLFTRARLRNSRLMERMKREEHDRNEMVRTVQEQVKSRQAVLDAIGHEIKSPLQTLLIKIPENSEYRNEIERMHRAIEALYLATSVEAGLQNGNIIMQSIDIAAYLAKLAQNLSDQGKMITYNGPVKPVIAMFDPIVLNTVLEHLLDNAFRHKLDNTEVTISLESSIDGARVEVFNLGDTVATDMLESIFDYAVSTHKSSENKGIGLFAARIYLVGMRGTISAENRENGVAFIVTLPSALGEEVS